MFSPGVTKKHSWSFSRAVQCLSREVCLLKHLISESVAENHAGAVSPNDFSPLKQVEVPEKTKSLGTKHAGDSISDTVCYVS